jgi:hypothetical protein
MKAFLSIPLLNTSASDPLSSFTLSDAFIDAVTETEEQQLVVLAVVGEGRSGKSTFLNYVVGSLLERGIAATSALETDPGTLFQPFKTGCDIDPVTRGLDVLLLPLANGKLLILLDMEGLFNRDRPALDMILAIVSQLSDQIVYMDKCLSDNFRNSLGRLVGSSMMNAFNPENISWPQLHIVLNMTRLQVDDTSLARSFAPGDGVTDEIAQVSSLFQSRHRAVDIESWYRSTHSTFTYEP